MSNLPSRNQAIYLVRSPDRGADAKFQEFIIQATVGEGFDQGPARASAIGNGIYSPRAGWRDLQEMLEFCLGLAQRRFRVIS